MNYFILCAPLLMTHRENTRVEKKKKSAYRREKSEENKYAGHRENQDFNIYI